MTVSQLTADVCTPVYTRGSTVGLRTKGNTKQKNKTTMTNVFRTIQFHSSAPEAAVVAVTRTSGAAVTLFFTCSCMGARTGARFGGRASFEAISFPTRAPELSGFRMFAFV